MDGSNAAFLFDSPNFSAHRTLPAGGILYVEDFDAGPAAPDNVASAEPVPASHTPDELAAAYAAGREAGLAAAVADAQLIQAQLHLAATQSLSDGLAAARDVLEGIATQAAETLAQTILAVLQAAVPATMQACAAGELGLVMAALAPGLRFEPELRVRAHADMADCIRETLIGLLPAETCVLSVCADSALAKGDIRIAWRDGHAQRDCGAIWAGIVAALAPLGLPTLEEICHGRGC